MGTGKVQSSKTML